jgi:hypothetical protein
MTLVDAFDVPAGMELARKLIRLSGPGENKMDLLLVLILLLLLFGGGGGLYWGLGAGWGLGPIGLIVVVLVVAWLLYGYRGRRGPPL